MWSIRVVILVHVLQIHLLGCNSKPQASVHSETISRQPTYSNLELWNASRDGNLAEIKCILTTDHDINWKNQDNFGYTSLHIASEQNHPAIMRVILDAGAIKDKLDNNGFTSVFHASDQGHIGALSTLINYRANVNIGNNNNYTPLMQSTGKGYFNIVEALIDANANVSHQDSLGMTALHEAATYNRIKIAWLLVWKGADASKKGNQGERPSDLARYHGYYQLENILQDFAGNYDVLSAGTVSPINSGLDLWNAARDGNLASVKIAIDKNIDHNWRNTNQDGSTSLHIAALNNHPLVMSELMNAGAGKNMQDNKGLTPIFIASGRGNLDAVLTLIKYDADVDVDVEIISGFTPLMQAAGKGYTAIVEELIKANATVNIQDKDGNTAFAVAAALNRQHIAQLLFTKGADPKKIRNDGLTPANWARERGYSSLANIIDVVIGVTDPTEQLPEEICVTTGATSFLPISLRVVLGSEGTHCPCNNCDYGSVCWKTKYKRPRIPDN